MITGTFTSRLLRNYIINFENAKICDMHQRTRTFLDLQGISINLSISRLIKSYLSALLCSLLCSN